jgi:hypothetical protein
MTDNNLEIFAICGCVFVEPSLNKFNVRWRASCPNPQAGIPPFLQNICAEGDTPSEAVKALYEKVSPRSADRD